MNEHPSNSAPFPSNGGGAPQGEPAPQAVSSTMDTATPNPSSGTDQTPSHADSPLSAWKVRASRDVAGVADALRHASGLLRTDEPGAVTHYVDRVAEGADRVSGYLRDRSIREVAGDVGNFARREPAIFVGSAFVVGLMAGRFLKSSGGV